MGQAETHEAHRRRDIAGLIKQLHGGDAETRSLAAHYLGRLRSPAAVPALVESLDDESEMVRMSVLRALARIGDKSAVPRVVEAAEGDPALAVSARATEVLADLGESVAIPQFVSLLVDTDRHLANGRHQTSIPRGMESRLINTSYPRVKWRFQKWAARRLVELQAREAAPAIETAAGTASSLRERFLLRRTVWSLRHPPWRVRHPKRRLRGYLWWWVVLLGVFVVAAKVTGNGSAAWTVTQYFALTFFGLVLLLVLVGGLLELRDRRRNRDS